MNIKPLFDRVVLKIEKEQTTNVGGIFLPDMSKEKSQLATVVSVGNGGFVDGKETKMQVSVGDKVLFSKFAGTEFKFNNEDLLIIKQTDILAIISKEENNG
jgi:chaperonin GroES